MSSCGDEPRVKDQADTNHDVLSCRVVERSLETAAAVRRYGTGNLRLKTIRPFDLAAAGGWTD